MPDSDIALIGSYDQRVVALSIVIAVLGAYAGLDLAERVTAARGGARVAWLIGGATAIGIWSMHYTSPTRACSPFICRSRSVRLARRPPRVLWSRSSL